MRNSKERSIPAGFSRLKRQLVVISEPLGMSRTMMGLLEPLVSGISMSAGPPWSPAVLEGGVAAISRSPGRTASSLVALFSPGHVSMGFARIRVRGGGLSRNMTRGFRGVEGLVENWEGG